MASLLFAVSAEALPFTIKITNTGTDAAYPWSTGLLTLSPTITIGPSPQPGSAAYPTYTFANSNCNVADAFCPSGSCLDNGNAVVLAQRLGLTIGVNAWLVPPLAAASNATAVVTIDAPAGSRLSFIAWINDTSVFDDFVAMYPTGGLKTTLSVPLFDASGNAIANPVFTIAGYDTNSTSATDGSGGTCSPECPTPATGCYVAPGNASLSTYPDQPTVPSPALTVTMSGPATTTTAQNTYSLSFRNQSTAAVSGTLSYTLPAGATYVSSSNSGMYNATTRTVTWPAASVNAGATLNPSRTVVVDLGAFSSTTTHTGQVSWTTGNGNGTRRWTAISSAVQTVYKAGPVWTFTDPLGRITDGLAVGDFVQGNNAELVVVLPASATSAGGATVINSATGELVSTFSPGTGRSAMGFPLAEQLTAGGASEYLFGEPLPLSSNAGLYARNGNSIGATWTSIPYGYASYWNMGPSSANVTTAVGNEVLVADWEGNVRLLRAADGQVLSSYNTWTSDQDHAFGHVALAADVDGDSAVEAIVAGYVTGSVIVLEPTTPTTLTRQWKSASLKTRYGDSPYGSGPAVGNIDGDSRAEIVVATYGTNSDIYAFDVSQQNGSTCEHRFRPGGGYFYTSPVIGDVDGSGVKSIVVMSSTTAVLSVMKAGTPGCETPGGQIVWQHTVKAGDFAAFTPVLYDVTGDGVLDVIVASNTRLQIIDVRNRNVLFTYDDATAAFSPSAVISNADKTGPANVTELYVTGWRNSKVFRFALPSTATNTNEWTTFMGNNARTGAR